MAAWNDPRVKPHVRAAAVEIRDRFGIANIGGWRATGSVQNSDHPKGLALDVMTTLRGTEISAWAIANASRLSITYIIWNRQIWRGGQWTRYTGPSPHTDHVHLSFSASPGTGGANVDSLTGDGQSSTSGDPLSGCLKAILDMLNPLA